MRTRRFLWPAIVAVIGALVLVIAMPSDWKRGLPPQLGFLTRPALHLGLDLVGGTQLDFRISEEEIRAQEEQINKELEAGQARKAPDEELAVLRNQLASIREQKGNLVEAIRTVLERRINALGVSEATITPSYVGDEKHLLVECPGVVDTQECIRVVGKTIQLEFKEEFTTATDEYVKDVKAKAQAALRRIVVSGATLQAVGQDLGDQLGVSYQEGSTLFRDQLPSGLEDAWTLPPGRVVLREGTVQATREGAQGAPVTEDVPGVFILEVTRPRTETGRVLTTAATAFAHLAKTEEGVAYAARRDIALNGRPPVNDTRIENALRTMAPGELRAVSTGSGVARVLFLESLRRGQEQVDVSHILVAYKGATAATPDVTRTQEEALARSLELKKRLDGGADFAALARRESDGPSRERGGVLGSIARGTMVPAFEDVAFTLPAGKVSDPVETPFGYHLIRVKAAAAKTPDVASYDDLTVTSAPREAAPTAIGGPSVAPEIGTDPALARGNALIEKLKNGSVRATEEAITLRTLFFSLQPTGWKDTALDGKHFRAAGVTLDPSTNIPVVQIAFDTEGGRMFQELTRNNIGKRIAIFVGGELVSAPTVQAEIAGGTAVITGSSSIEEARTLAQDLNTGAIPAPIHLVGQYTVEATLGAAALRTSLFAALIGTIVLMLYMILVYRMLGVMADIALTLYAVLLFALLKLPLLLVTSNYVVLTLAGMAGIILSIGMAVDANVLVFERMKEELRKGKLPKTAVETSFAHAWLAIRDGNISALITCAFLFLLGSSIVRGFAVTLGIGVALSMFTAVTVTRWLLRRLVASPLGQRLELFGVKRSV